MKYLSLLLIIGSAGLYHACQKHLSKCGNLYVQLAATYLIAFVMAVILTSPWKTTVSGLGQLRSIVLPLLGLGLACVGVELGYMLAYRNGWDMSVLATQSMIGSATTIALIGTLFFGEPFSAKMMLGVVLGLGSIAVMHLK